MPHHVSTDDEPGYNASTGRRDSRCGARNSNSANWRSSGPPARLEQRPPSGWDGSPTGRCEPPTAVARARAAADRRGRLADGVRTNLSEEMFVPIITAALTDRSQPRLYKPNLSTTSEEFSGGAGVQRPARSSSTFTCDEQALAAPIGFALADRS